MSSRWAAFVAAVTLSCGLTWAQGPRMLTLDTAFSRTLENHPDPLEHFGFYRGTDD